MVHEHLGDSETCHSNSNSVFRGPIDIKIGFGGSIKIFGCPVNAQDLGVPFIHYFSLGGPILKKIFGGLVITKKRFVFGGFMNAKDLGLPLIQKMWGSH